MGGRGRDRVKLGGARTQRKTDGVGRLEKDKGRRLRWTGAEGGGGGPPARLLGGPLVVTT
jgi:hypothetical protein